MEYLDVVQSLKNLSQLHAAGVLSDDEFARAKRQVVGSSGPAAAPTPGHGEWAPDPMEAPTLVRPRYRVEGNVTAGGASPMPEPQAVPAISLEKTLPPVLPSDTVQIPAQRADRVATDSGWDARVGSSAPAGQPVSPPPMPTTPPPMPPMEAVSPPMRPMEAMSPPMRPPMSPPTPPPVTWMPPAQTMPPPAPSRPQHAGAIVAALAAVATGAAFLFLPLVSVGPFGVTGSRLASLGSLPGGGWFYALWLIPVAAAAVLVLALRQLMDPPLSASGQKATLISLSVLATATAVAYVAMLIVVQQQLSSSGAGSIGISVFDLAGSGFWVALGSIITAAVAGGVELGVNRGTSDGARRSPHAPPPSVGRNVAFIVTAVVVVLGMAGVAIWNTTSAPTTPAQNLAALENQGTSSTVDQGSSSGGSDSSGSSSTGQQASPVQEPATFVESYYNLLPGNPDAAWAMLSPEQQAASGTQQAFDDFWSGISSVSLENVQTLDQSTVEATVVFTRTDGTWTREDYQFSISDSNGQQVIQTATQRSVLSSGSGSSSQGSTGGASASGAASMGIVDVSAVSSDPRAGEIGTALDQYFSGINQRNWTQALSALDPRVVDQSDPNQVARFEHAESTTTDSSVVVQSIQSSSDAPNGESATVTFQSHQDPSLGPDGESCTLWKLDYQFSNAAGVSVYIYKSKGTHTAC